MRVAHKSVISLKSMKFFISLCSFNYTQITLSFVVSKLRLEARGSKVRLLAMWRGELSVAIVWLMSKCLLSGGSGSEELNK